MLVQLTFIKSTLLVSASYHAHEPEAHSYACKVLFYVCKYSICGDIIRYVTGMQYGHTTRLHVCAARGDDPGTDGFRQKPLPETLKNANQAEALLQQHTRTLQAAQELADAKQAHATLSPDKVCVWQQTLCLACFDHTLVAWHL